VGFWYFFPTEKGLGPGGYERSENMNAWWVPPSIREISYLMKICFCLWQIVFNTFSLMKKYLKNQERTMLPLL